jgi:hypothetical protein
LPRNYKLAVELDIRDKNAEWGFTFVIVEGWLCPLHLVSQETASTCYEWLIQNLKFRGLTTKWKDEVNKLYLAAFHRAREKLIHVRNEK